ncbi:flagellar export chaperone FliS [Piscinibacter sp. Jin2]|uniref:Flagellar secretion chaperone FliS n=1 Tax=Aquariibacter lacus TaxID=2801332 RepID=A0A9X1BR79_9BURK|nr:flagellar export chaperone FliS [Piscinibacter lacus]MBL0720451.1 flagellar export chaperone FliS [Piscinibacter lacus]
MHAFASPFAPRRSSGLANAYRQVGVETEVDAANPHQLITMLYGGLVDSIQRARGAMRQGEIADKGAALTRAIRILEEGLRSALDRSAGGALAEQLDGLYSYLAHRLLEANLRNDEAMLDECLRLVQPLREAWAAIGPQVLGQPGR